MTDRERSPRPHPGIRREGRSWYSGDEPDLLEAGTTAIPAGYGQIRYTAALQVNSIEERVLLSAYAALSCYGLLWRWRLPGRIVTKIGWTFVCLLGGAVLMVELSRPTEPEPFDWPDDRLPLPGAGLSVLSGSTLLAGLAFGAIGLVDEIEGERHNLENFGSSICLVLLGAYGLSRAKRLLENKTRGARAAV